MNLQFQAISARFAGLRTFSAELEIRAFRHLLLNIFRSSSLISPQIMVGSVIIFSSSSAVAEKTSPSETQRSVFAKYFWAANRFLPAFSTQIILEAILHLPYAVISNEGTPTRGKWRERQRPLAKASPILRLVKEPGPMAAPIHVRDENSNPVSFNAEPIAGGSSTVCRLLECHISVSYTHLTLPTN